MGVVLELGFTVFNTVTLFILALAIVLVVQRLRLRLRGNWPLAYYAVALAYAFAFPYSLKPLVLLAGMACAILLRFKKFHWGIRTAEIAVLLYVIWRSVALLMGW